MVLEKKTYGMGRIQWFNWAISKQTRERQELSLPEKNSARFNKVLDSRFFCLNFFKEKLN